jgi:hypothetical protein
MTANQIRKAMDIHDVNYSRIGQNKDGDVVVRFGFFYEMRRTEASVAKRVQDALDAVTFVKARVVETRTEYKPRTSYFVIVVRELKPELICPSCQADLNIDGEKCEAQFGYGGFEPGIYCNQCGDIVRAI